MDKVAFKQNRSEILRKNGFFAAIIFIILGLLIGGMCLLNLIFGGLFILVVPLIILPTAFAFIRAVIAMREENVLTFKIVWDGVRQFFNERFISTFAFWRVVLITIIIAVISSLVIGLSVNLSFYYTNYMNFKVIVNELYQAIFQEGQFEAVLRKYQREITIIDLCSTYPVSFVTSLFVFCAFTINAGSIFPRLTALKYNGRYITLMYRSMLKSSRSYRLNFLKYNAPMLILFTIGYGAGGYVGYLYDFSSNSIQTFSLAFATFLGLGGYGAIYFANLEALYNSFIPDIEKADQAIKFTILEKMRSSLNLQLQNKEEQEKILEALEKELKNNNEDDSSIEDNSGE